MKKIVKVFLFTIIVVIILSGVAYLLVPRVRSFADRQIHELYVRISYAVKPPEEEVFIPKTPVATLVKLTHTPTLTPTPAPTLEISPTPTLTPTPLPEMVDLKDVPYVHQHGLWNYCGPANLTMPLQYWGWPGKREEIGPVIKPFERDKNVSPYEMADFVENHTDLLVEQRFGGTAELLKRLLANGFPVLIEKGVYFFETLTGREGWMGHYNVVIGYDEAAQEFIVHDSYIQKNREFPTDGEHMRFPYQTLMDQWRSYNYVFLVVYPQEKKELLLETLAEYADYDNSVKLAARIAQDEIETQTEVQRFFAMFNLGTSQVLMYDYASASASYDEAFLYYSTLPEARRPWRMMWYQFGPYLAYYYTGRYQDVVDLATKTLEAAPDPYLEESWYWRAMAEVKLGNQKQAIEDLKTSLKYHEGYKPALELLQSLGVSN